MNFALYKKEIKGSFKILLIFAGVLTMYIVMIVSMYDPELSDALKQFEELMPELMSAVGMTGANETLTDFMSSYLYGMILLVFPMVYTVIRANGLIAKYVDRGSMAQLLAAPVKRSKIAVTQLTALISGIAALIFYCTVLEYGAAQMMFPGELSLTVLLRLNAGLLCLHLFIAAFCFLCSCAFGDSRCSVTAGAGVPVLMLLFQMLANMGGKLEKIRCFTFFTLFDPDGLVSAEPEALLFAGILLVLSVILFALAVAVFKKKDLHL